MVGKGFLSILVMLLFAPIAICSPVLLGRNDGDGNSTTIDFGTTASSTSAAAPASPTVLHASDDPNGILWTPGSNTVPEPERGSLGASIIGPQNVPVELQNADLLAPPTTDNGNM